MATGSFRSLVEAEMARIRDKCVKYTSWHEAYGILAEELDEFWDEVKKKSGKRDRVNSLHELVQLAARAELVALDLALYVPVTTNAVMTIKNTVGPGTELVPGIGYLSKY